MSWGQSVTRSPYAASSAVNAIDEAVRPPYSRVQVAPAAVAAASIGRIGVMPMPPATKTYDGEGCSAKWLRGPATSTVWPGRKVSWTYAEPPRPPGSCSTPSR